MTTKKRDYYDVLGIARDASNEDVLKAFRKLAKRYHPDVDRSDGAADRFKEINEAYQVLSDQGRRRRYDQFGHAGVSNGGQTGFSGAGNFGGFGDIFEAFFGDLGGGARTRSARRGADLQVRVTLRFEEAAFGTDKRISVERTESCESCMGTRAEPGTSPQTCGNCQGQGRVRRVEQGFFGQFVQVVTCPACRGEGSVISAPCGACQGSGTARRMRKLDVAVPPGIGDGERLRLRGEGDCGLDGGPSGDLLVSIGVEAHPHLERKGNDVRLVSEINIVQAALGATVTVPTLGGHSAVEVPPGTQTGQVVKLDGAGIPHLDNPRRRGDQLVKFFVLTPEGLSDEQRELLERLGATLPEGGDAAADDGRGWVGKIRDTIPGI